VRVHGDVRDLAEDPVVRQRLRPERVDEVLRHARRLIGGDGCRSIRDLLLGRYSTAAVRGALRKTGRLSPKQPDPDEPDSEPGTAQQRRSTDHWREMLPSRKTDRNTQEVPMRYRCLAAVTAAAITAASGWVVAQTSAGRGPAGAAWTAPRTAWGAPDLSGIWNSKSLTPLERPARFANREFLTDEEIAVLERGNARQRGRDVRAKSGTEADVEGAYNQIFATALDAKYGRNKRTSLIVDPPDGKLPAMTPDGQKRRDAIRRGAARSPEAAEAALAAFGEGTKETPYTVDVICSPLNSAAAAKVCRPMDNPEDLPGIERCSGLTSMPCIGGGCAMTRLVQGPASLMIYIEQGHGGGEYRTIHLDGQPHPPAHVREWLGHSTGHWEGDTLVVETTNFTDRTSFQGTSGEMRMTERFTRAGPDLLLYRVTIDDPKSFTRPWTFEVPLTLQDNKANLIFESACYEGNYALTSMLAGARKLEREYRTKRR
jgi:hypothetical protein